MFIWINITYTCFFIFSTFIFYKKNIQHASLKKVYTGNPYQEINYDSKYLARKLLIFFSLFNLESIFLFFFNLTSQDRRLERKKTDDQDVHF